MRDEPCEEKDGSEMKEITKKTPRKRKRKRKRIKAKKCPTGSEEMFYLYLYSVSTTDVISAFKPSTMVCSL